MESVIFEIRPRIQVCNIYILMKELLDSNSLNLRVSQSEIILTFPRNNNSNNNNNNNVVHKIMMLDSYRLMPHTVSSFSVQKNSVYFRVLTEPRNNIMGSFASEILPFVPEPVEKQTNMFIPKIDCAQPCKITCKTCGLFLTEYIIFKRVLPLPTNLLDMNEWFCHKHEHSESNQLTYVKHGDCLYGLFFVLINSSVFSFDVNKVIMCKRCLSWLGTCKDTVAKLWNCTVDFGDYRNTSSSLQDFTSVVVDSLSKTVGLMSKIILETSVSEHETHYLLVWALDKDLSIFFKSFPPDNNADSSSVEIESALNLKNVMKVLYLPQTHLSELVRHWRDDIYVQSIDVAKQMFSDGLSYLMSITECIPNPHKTFNNFFVSYIDIK